jgi:hypothetical protein
MTMRFKGLLVAALLVLLPGLAVGQDLIRYYPPAGIFTSSGSQFFASGIGLGNTVASPYANLYGDAANTLAMRNGGTTGTPVPQTFNIYNFCDGAACVTGSARGSIRMATNFMYIETASAGTGDTSNIIIQSNRDAVLLGKAGGNQFIANGTSNYFGGVVGNTSNLGASTSYQWNNLYLISSIQGSKSKALTDAAATAFVRIAIPQTIATNYKGGQVIYEIYCDDDTNQASQAGTVKFTCHNLAGTEACGFGTPDGVTLGDGTLSLAAPTFDASSAAADTIDLRVTSDCTGAAPNTHTIEYRLDMPTTATITPQ